MKSLITNEDPKSLFARIVFGEFTGARVLNLPFIQGDPESVPANIREYYGDIIAKLVLQPGKVGYLTLDEGKLQEGEIQRASHMKHERPLHTEVGIIQNTGRWGNGGNWREGTSPDGGHNNVEVDLGTEILIASSVANTCAIWDATVEDTSDDGDIGDRADEFPYEDATLMGEGEVHKCTVLTPHEPLPMPKSGFRQFIRIVGQGLTGTASYFTHNHLLPKYAEQTPASLA